MKLKHVVSLIIFVSCMITALIIRFAYPDKTQARIFIDHWPVIVPLLIAILITGYYLSEE